MKYEVVGAPDGQRALKPDLLRLFAECYSKELSDEWWDYLYMSGPYGCALSIAAWDSDGLAGHYAAAPMEAVGADGERIRFARGMTLAIAERARSRGALPELMRRMRSALIDRGLAWTLGFPNERSWRPLTMFCGWRVLFESPTAVWDVKLGAGADSIVEAPPRIWDGLAPPYADPTFMRWRSRMRPFRTFLADGAAVVAKVYEGDALDVVDAWRVDGAGDGEAVHGLARSLSLQRICMSLRHAQAVGMDPTGCRMTGCTIRQAGAPNGDSELPPFRFSLLFSDVY